MTAVEDLLVRRDVTRSGTNQQPSELTTYTSTGALSASGSADSLRGRDSGICDGNVETDFRRPPDATGSVGEVIATRNHYEGNNQRFGVSGLED
jgi:hypothetical protein